MSGISKLSVAGTGGMGAANVLAHHRQKFKSEMRQMASGYHVACGLQSLVSKWRGGHGLIGHQGDTGPPRPKFKSDGRAVAHRSSRNIRPSRRKFCAASGKCTLDSIRSMAVSSFVYFTSMIPRTLRFICSTGDARNGERHFRGALLARMRLSP